MTITTVPSNRAILLVAAALVSLVAGQGIAGEAVSIRLTDGSKLIAEVHPRTNDEQLWLRLASGRAVILRGVAWDRIAEATIGGEPVNAAALRRMAVQQTGEDESAPATVIPPTEPSYAGKTPILPSFRYP